MAFPRKRGLASALAVSSLALAFVACSQEQAAAPVSMVGASVDNFLLVDQDGMAHTLRYNRTAPAVVLVSHKVGDKTSADAAAALAALHQKFPGAEMLMINSSDGRDAIAAEAKQLGLAVPVLDDGYKLIGDSLGMAGAERVGFSTTGEAIAIDPKTWTVAYHGPVGPELEKAVSELAAGSPVSVASAKVKGAKIAFPDAGRAAEFATISYKDEVAPILLKRCVDCHQPGGIGTWQMTNYEMIKGFAPMIREAIRTDRMPPYDVDPHVGAFKNSENMTEAETRTLIRWIEAGPPRGEGDDPLLAGVTQRPDWPLGEPDVIVDIPSYTVPAAGVVDYQMPVVASPMKEAKWLKATTFKAGSRQGVHHILAGWMPKMPASGRGFDWDVNMGGYAVGSETNHAPEGWATYVPAGGAISFQMHYTPFGKEYVDNSKIAFYFQDEAPTYLKRQIVVVDPTLTIQPGVARHHERGYVQFPAAVQLTAAQPHAHYRGYASKLTAIFPDGKEQVILNMPKYDFNWQREYIFEELIDLPAGTKLVADYWYDNSANNPANPDPEKLVAWGDQSFEEMLFTAVQFRWVDETADNRRDDLQEALSQSVMFTAVDDNLDGLIQESELKSEMLEPLKPHFAALDLNGDGGLSPQEFGAGLQKMQEAAAARQAARNAGGQP